MMPRFAEFLYRISRGNEGPVERSAAGRQVCSAEAAQPFGRAARERCDAESDGQAAQGQPARRRRAGCGRHWDISWHPAWVGAVDRGGRLRAEEARAVHRHEVDRHREPAEADGQAVPRAVVQPRRPGRQPRAVVRCRGPRSAPGSENHGQPVGGDCEAPSREALQRGQESVQQSVSAAQVRTRRRSGTNGAPCPRCVLLGRSLGPSSGRRWTAIR